MGSLIKELLRLVRSKMAPRARSSSFRSLPCRGRRRTAGCSTETGSDAGKVFLRASSSASSWCLRSRLSRSLSS
jgi:hypothetical protein